MPKSRDPKAATSFSVASLLQSCWPKTDTSATDDSLTRRSLLASESKRSAGSMEAEQKTSEASAAVKVRNRLFHDLPEVLWLETMSYQTPKELLRLMQTCKTFNTMLIKKLTKHLSGIDTNLKRRQDVVELISSWSEESIGVANYFLNLFEVFLDANELTKIAGRSYEEIAFRIIQNPDYQQLATPQHLGQMAEKSPRIANFIMSNQTLRSKIETSSHELRKAEEGTGFYTIETEQETFTPSLDQLLSAPTAPWQNQDETNSTDQFIGMQFRF